MNLQGTALHDPESDQKVGVLTRTVIQGSAARWLLTARLAGDKSDYLISIAERHLHIHKLDDQGHLVHVLTKDDFVARIRSAKIFDDHEDSSIEPDLSSIIKVEDEPRATTGKRSPSIVLSLSTDELCFLTLRATESDRPQVLSHTVALPRFANNLQQPGQQMAVDPRSRAIALSAFENQIAVLAVVPDDQSLGTRPPTLCQRIFRLGGVILRIEFLSPGKDHPDHVILLVIVQKDLKLHASWIEWQAPNDIYSAQIHPGQVLDRANVVHPLLIPLNDASFALIYENEGTHWRNLLTGSAVATPFDLNCQKPCSASHGRRLPQWTAWSKPRRLSNRNKGKDFVYLAREDGCLNLTQVGSDGIIHCGTVARVDCTIGVGFTSIGGDWTRDVLAVTGDACSGQIISLPKLDDLTQSFPSTDTGYDIGYDFVELLPNWAPTTDLLVTNASRSGRKALHDCDAVYVTSGRQPYGTISELRSGCEAQLLLCVDIADLATLTGAWIIHTGNEALFILLSRPVSSLALTLSLDGSTVEELDGDMADIFDLSSRSIAAATLQDGRVVQVTEHAVRIASMQGGRCDIKAAGFNIGTSVLTAMILAESRDILLGLKSTTGHRVQLLKTDDVENLTASVDCEIPNVSSLNLDAEPLALVQFSGRKRQAFIVSTADGKVQIIDHSNEYGIRSSETLTLSIDTDGSPISDHMAIIQAEHGAAVLVCGLRDGRIATHRLGDDDETVAAGGEFEMLDFGKSTVRLSNLTPTTVCAVSGAQTCHVSWNASQSSLNIQRIWLADKLRPEMRQDALQLVVPVPSAISPASSALANAVMMLSGNQLLFANVQVRSATIPRQIKVNGTPNRLIYMEQQRSLVSSSLQCDLRTFAAAGTRSEQRRQTYPVLDFIPIKHSSPSFSYRMQPGSKVHALLEWSITFGADKTYSYLLVGGSYVRKSGTERGRIAMLQPVNRRWKVVDVREGPVTRFEEPVYALALYDAMTYVACAGCNVHIQRFKPELKRWVPVCRPLKLLSIGLQITTAKDRTIHISAAADSLVVLHLVEGDGRSAELMLLQSPPRASNGLGHLVVDAKGRQLILAANKDGRVVGLTAEISHASHTTYQGYDETNARALFEARLPRSIVRLSHGNVRPSWRPPLAQGVLHHQILGSCTDGALVGFALLDADLWRRLFWLQRLCEWDVDHSQPRTPGYVRRITYLGRGAMDETGDDATVLEAFPLARQFLPGLGYGSDQQDETIELRTRRSSYDDMHIDGDTLSRLFVSQTETAEEAVCNILRRMAERGRSTMNDDICRWVEGHLDSELQQVPHIIADLENVINAWL